MREYSRLNNNSNKLSYFLLGASSFIIILLAFFLILVFNIRIGKYSKHAISPHALSNNNIFYIKPNSVALVTGASGGIGEQTSKILHLMGAHVILSGRDKIKLDKLQESLGPRCSVEVCDLQNLESCVNLISKIKTQFGRLDILVCNGGGTAQSINTIFDKSKSSYDQLSKVIKVNLESTYVLNNEAINLMKEVGTGGKIINISSVAALIGSTGFGLSSASGTQEFGYNVDYAAAKAGLLSMTRGLASKASEYGININCICPGAIETNMTKDLPSFLRVGLTQLMIPMKRLGKPEEIGYVVAFFASEQASYVTGATLIVDGGLVAH